MPLRAIDLQRYAVPASLEVRPVHPYTGVRGSYPATYPASPAWPKIPNPGEKCGLEHINISISCEKVRQNVLNYSNLK